MSAPPSSPSQPVVLVTGCSDGGIGTGLVIEFVRCGCLVYASSRKLSSMKISEAAGARLVELDVTSQPSIDKAVQKVLSEAGRLDIVVNNAGFAIYAPILDVEPEQLRAIFETNVIGPMAIARAVAPHMVARGSGKIVQIGSISGLVVSPYAGAYCATKSALHSLSDALRMEVAPFGVEVTVVCPGAVRSMICDKSVKKDSEATLPSSSLYLSASKYVTQRAQHPQRNPTPTDVFAKNTVREILKKHSAPYFLSGNMTSWYPLLRWLPVWLLDWIFSRQFGLHLLGRPKKD